MEERIRIAAMIIKDCKLLLVKTNKYKEYWTPGGKLEEGESEVECLRRELSEELNVKLTSAQFFKKYVSKSFYDKNAITINVAYTANISGEPKVGKEINSYIWMSKNEFENSKYPLIPSEREEVIPDLIKVGFF